MSRRVPWPWEPQVELPKATKPKATDPFFWVGTPTQNPSAHRRDSEIRGRIDAYQGHLLEHDRSLTVERAREIAVGAARRVEDGDHCPVEGRRRR